MSQSTDTVTTVDRWISAEGVAVKVINDLPAGVPAVAFRTEAGPCILVAGDTTAEQRSDVVEALAGPVWGLPLVTDQALDDLAAAFELGMQMRALRMLPSGGAR